MKYVNYLDVKDELRNDPFRSYHKPDDKIQYMHTEFNDPWNIIKRVPTSKENRLSNLSSNEKLFQDSTRHYEDYVRLSGYNKKLTYKATDTNEDKHSKHKRKII